MFCICFLEKQIIILDPLKSLCVKVYGKFVCTFRVQGFKGKFSAALLGNVNHKIGISCKFILNVNHKIGTLCKFIVNVNHKIGTLRKFIVSTFVVDDWLLVNITYWEDS